MPWPSWTRPVTSRPTQTPSTQSATPCWPLRAAWTWRAKLARAPGRYLLQHLRGPARQLARSPGAGHAGNDGPALYRLARHGPGHHARQGHDQARAGLPRPAHPPLSGIPPRRSAARPGPGRRYRRRCSSSPTAKAPPSASAQCIVRDEARLRERVAYLLDGLPRRRCWSKSTWTGATSPAGWWATWPTRTPVPTASPARPAVSRRPAIWNGLHFLPLSEYTILRARPRAYLLVQAQGRPGRRLSWPMPGATARRHGGRSAPADRRNLPRPAAAWISRGWTSGLDTDNDLQPMILEINALPGMACNQRPDPVRRGRRLDALPAAPGDLQRPLPARFGLAAGAPPAAAAAAASAPDRLMSCGAPAGHRFARRPQASKEN